MLTPQQKYARRQERRNALHAKRAAAAEAKNVHRVDGPHSLFCLRGEGTHRQAQLAKSIEDLSAVLIEQKRGTPTTLDQVQHGTSTRPTKLKAPGEKSPVDRFLIGQLLGAMWRGRSRRRLGQQAIPRAEDATS